MVDTEKTYTIDQATLDFLKQVRKDLAFGAECDDPMVAYTYIRKAHRNFEVLCITTHLFDYQK